MRGRRAASRDVAQAIGEQYLPLSATAPLPAGLAGGLLAVADKADNIVGAWVAGEKPSGSRDPYGLRRAAMGIVRIALEYALRFGVDGLLARRPGRLRRARASTTHAATASSPRRPPSSGSACRCCCSTRACRSPWCEAALALVGGRHPGPGGAGAQPSPPCEGRDFFDDVVTAYNRCAALAAKASGRGAGGRRPGAVQRRRRARAARGPGRCRGPLSARRWRISRSRARSSRRPACGRPSTATSTTCW